MKTNITSLVEEASNAVYKALYSPITPMSDEALKRILTEPTTLEQFMATLTPEQRELAKSLKIERG